MAWKDELNNAKKVFKNGTPKEKLEYFWEYYKWHLIILVLIVGAISNLIYTNVAKKDYVLQGMFLNTLAVEGAADDLEQGFLEFSPIDTSAQDIFFDTSLYYSPNAEPEDATASYEALQVITAKAAIGGMDFIVADSVTMNYMTYGQYFLDLSKVFTEEQLKEYEPYFLYYDKAFLEKLNNTDAVSEEASLIAYPDPEKPELMEDPIPVMINVSKNEQIENLYVGLDNIYALAFTASGTNQEKARDFIDYLLK